MLSIKIAPAPRTAWRDRHEDRPPEHFGGNYFKRADLQGGFGELIVQDIDTHALLIAVPLRRFQRDYRYTPPQPVKQSTSHVILEFRAR